MSDNKNITDVQEMIKCILDGWINEFYFKFTLGSRGVLRGVAKGGIWGSEPTPLAQNILVIFTKTVTKRRSGVYPQRFRTLKTPSFGNFWPQNPLLRPFLATPLDTQR